jgi:hypothetical protein
VVGGFAQQELLQVWREFRKGLVHVGEHRVATAVFRALGDVQNRRQRRDLLARYIGMPCFTIGELGTWLGIHNEQLGVVMVHAIAFGRMHMQLAKMPAEGLVLFAGEDLVAEN